ASTGDEIWVAEGIYLPGSDESDSFDLVDGIAIYGGFSATETLRSERDWETNLTVLSGDVDSNDTTDEDGLVVDSANIIGNNADHVVEVGAVANTTVLDGFTITAGQADGSNWQDEDGGGMRIESGDPTLSNLTFIGNMASENGGGLVGESSESHLTNLTFIANTARFGGGARFYSGQLDMTGFFFQGNASTDVGGGMLIEDGVSTMRDVTFHQNSASSGGGMYMTFGTLSITDVTFRQNTATFDGGGLIKSYGDLTLTNVIFEQNTASSRDGGGMFNGDDRLTINNTIFKGNSAGGDGGGLYNVGSVNTELTNVAFYGNSATTGGGIEEVASSSAFVNITLSGNKATSNGGGIHNESSALTFHNSMIWNNQANGVTNTVAASIYNNGGSTSISYSLVGNSGGSGSWDSNTGTDGGNNIDSDPLFNTAVDPSSAPSAAGDLSLPISSPAVNQGSNILFTSSITTDLAGGQRIALTTIDMGAYEHSCGSHLFADKDASGGSDGTSWEDAYTDLQAALTYAAACQDTVEEIWVAEGVYTPGPYVTDTFSLADDLAIYGGFAATETLRSQRDWENNLTILSGDIDGNDTVDSNGLVTNPANISGNNADHVVSAIGLNTTAILDGFFITAGQADGGGSFGNFGGGGLIDSGSPTLINLTFIGNRADQLGGALFLNQSESIITNAYFQSNSAVNGGGGLYVGDSDMQLTNALFSGNVANYGGGIMNEIGRNMLLTNVTLSGNKATSEGGGIHNDGGLITLANTVIWGNEANGVTTTLSSNFVKGSDGTASISYSLIQNSGGSSSWDSSAGVDGGNNLDDDPLFASPIAPASAPSTAGTFSLQPGSPVINQGSNALYTSVITTDLAGNDRIYDTTIDMGAFETPPHRLSLFFSGSGSGNVSGNGGDCTADCSVEWPAGTAVTLTATADAHMTFEGWLSTDPATAACGSSRICTIVMGGDREITAVFERIPTYTLTTQTAGTGSGEISVSPEAISYTEGTTVTLSATAGDNSSFSSWSGDCAGSAESCVVTMDAAKSVTATFDLIELNALTVNTGGSGSGSVSKSPDASAYEPGTIVTLTATAANGSLFSGWSGDCGGSTPSCTLTMDSDKAATATFTLEEQDVEEEDEDEEENEEEEEQDDDEVEEETEEESPVVLNEPADGETVDSATPTFSWGNAFDSETGTIVSYTLIITKESSVTRSAPITYTFTTTNTSYTLTDALPIGNYRWTVLGLTDGGDTVSTDLVYSFSVETQSIYLPFVINEADLGDEVETAEIRATHL
ncbi:MAG: choice-of-anchor Q domain-containing protein, partial [Chloroflexota bacterium]